MYLYVCENVWVRNMYKCIYTGSEDDVGTGCTDIT